MSLRVQIPPSGDLRNEIRRLSLHATRGGGIFGFASRDGIEDLFDDCGIDALLRRGGKFRLVVGMDAITDLNAINELCKRLAEPLYGNRLTVECFLHASPVIFHPKLSWLETGSEITFIVGSGNLTHNGLGPKTPGREGNWEAFALVDESASGPTINRVSSWLDQEERAGYLLRPDHPSVKARAVANIRQQKPPQRGRSVPTLPSPTTPIPVTTTTAAPEMLIVEVPRTRQGQLNLKQRVLGFFGLDIAGGDISLQQVEAASNDLGDVYSVRVSAWQSEGHSHLDVRALPDPSESGRDGTLLVFSRLDDTVFRYTIIRVSDTINRQKLRAFLSDPRFAAPRAHELVTVQVDPEELKSRWPEMPEHLMPTYAT